MDEQKPVEGSAQGSAEATDAAIFPPQLPTWPPILRFVSGLYTAQETISLGGPAGFPWPKRPKWVIREELRLDVDRTYPLMAASGTLYGGLTQRTSWVASLVAAGTRTWTGKIWYKDGAVGYTDVKIQVFQGSYFASPSATVTFTGGGQSDRVRTFAFQSAYFHPVDFEFDCVTGQTATTSIDTCAHPNRPATLPCETLTIQQVYRRSGFDVTTSAGSGTVPLAGAGPNAQWSDQEMHDAMQAYWSKFADKPQWAFWTFFAALHEMGTSLGGIMFDDIGPSHRQGTSIFTQSFIANAPAGDPNPAAWVQRMIFWTATHEMGHAFNLAHSWQKSAISGGHGPWIALTDEPEARSFMNYPYNVAGGQTAFFGDFEFRFSDQELLFMRHAPERFVQQGNAEWFDHHGFQSAAVSPEPALKLELRVNREKAAFEFMEPMTLELKLSNISTQPQLVDDSLLIPGGALTVIIKKAGSPARQWVPYAHYCWQPGRTVLAAGSALYQPLFVSAGQNGWDLAEPGNYMVQVALHIGDEDVVSNPLALRVTPPRGYDEELLAQDFFSEDVGRIIALDGSRFLQSGNDTLREVAAKMPKRRVALHASVALGRALARPAKTLVAESAAPDSRLAIKLDAASPDEAHTLLSAGLVASMPQTVESFGHIDAKWYVDQFSDWLAQEGAAAEAATVQAKLYKTMSARLVHGRKVLDVVLQEIQRRQDGYQKK